MLKNIFAIFSQSLKNIRENIELAAGYYINAAVALSLRAAGVEGIRIVEANSKVYQLLGCTVEDTVTDATTDGTMTITKVGENFLATCSVGDLILIYGGTTTADYGIYVIRTVTDDENLILTEAPSGSNSDVDFLVITDGVVVTSDDAVYMAGSARRYVTLRADMDYTTQVAHTKPVQTAIGVFKGYIFPVYNADNEELFFRETVPDRWDGVSDIVFHVKVALGNAEDVDDYFKFQLSWEHAVTGEPVPATTNDVPVEQIVITARNAQYDEYELSFTIDHDVDGAGSEVKAHELLAARLRRVDATNPDVTNDPIVLDWHTHYQTNKMAAGS